jgi:hypothetical protein
MMRKGGTSSSADASARQGKAVPVAPVDPAVQVAMMHAEFLLGQTRRNVEQLAATHALDPLLCRQLQTLLASAKIRPPPAPRSAPETQVAKKDTKKEVTGKNKWAREVMSDTSLLPTLVDTALSVTAGPILSSTQREAIVDIVGISQSRIANALTDPERQAAAQRWTQNTAKSAHQGLKGGLMGANDNWDKWYKKQLLDSDTRKERRKEERSLQEELRNERSQFHAPAYVGDTRSPSSDAAVSMTGLPVSKFSAITDNPATASVACLPSQQLADDSSLSTLTRAGAVTTTFSPWPGLVLTMSTVASSGSVDTPSTSGLDDQSGGRSLPPPPVPGQPTPPKPSISSQVAPPPPRRGPTGPTATSLPPLSPVQQPPPPHPASGVTASSLASQPLPPVPPPQYTTGSYGGVPSSLRPG